MAENSDGVFHFKIGNFECIAINDGNFVYTSESFFINPPKKRMDHVLREHNIASGEIITPWPGLFINTGKHKVLVDTGVGTEILPGITAIAAPGHTPGHMALAISSGGEQLLHISDTVLYPIHMEQPDWYPAFDFEPEQANM